MKKLIALFSFLFAANILFAQDANTLIAEGQKLEAAFDEVNALTKFKEVLKVSPQNLTALSRCSELSSSIGNKETSTKSRDAYFANALSYAQQAVKFYPESDIANVSMAIALGRKALVKSGKEKVASVKELKAYAEKAIKLNQFNFRAWHILGKWHYEVSNLSSFERAAAKLLFGAIPASSYANAILCYEKAKTLNKSFLLNYLELAKAYKKTGDNAKAKEQINTMLTLKNAAADDAKYKDEAKALLTSL